MSAVQQTLTGEDAELVVRERPDTFRWCLECDEWVLRSRWERHREHDWRAQKRAADVDEGQEDEEDEDEAPEKVGAWYDITLSYSVDYRFRVAAWSEHEAEEIAKDLQLDARPADSMHVHTEKRELEELYEDDAVVPDDFDPYGNERLHHAIMEAEDDD